jgi:hypothetical protein
MDGSGRFFCGRAAQRYDGRLLVFEPLLADSTVKYLSIMGRLYEAGGYLGPVDVGMAVTGLRGGESYHLRDNIWPDRTPYNKDGYRRTGRFPASQLASDPRGAARGLVLPLLRATTRDSYDPFSE